jgi:hypothetical protein
MSHWNYRVLKQILPDGTETIYTSLLAGAEALALFATQVAITHYKTAFQGGEQKG